LIIGSNNNITTQEINLPKIFIMVDIKINSQFTTIITMLPCSKT